MFKSCSSQFNSTARIRLNLSLCVATGRKVEYACGKTVRKKSYRESEERVRGLEYKLRVAGGKSSGILWHSARPAGREVLSRTPHLPERKLTADVQNGVGLKKRSNRSRWICSLDFVMGRGIE